jgi:uncharacterized membrane protein YfcA
MIDIAALPPWPLALLVLGVAFFYASAGFGGATGYLAVMSLFIIPHTVVASTSLVLTSIVAGVAFITYWRARHFQPRLLLPFLAASVPAAFIGGALKVSAGFYFGLLYLCLTGIGLYMLLSKADSRSSDVAPHYPPPLWAALLSGALVGLLSGIIGFGGGVIVAPLILLSGWGTSKQTAAATAGFILANGLSGLVGRAVGGNLELGIFGLALVPVGLIGGLAGSYLGVRYFSGLTLRRLLGVFLLIAAGRYWIGILTG